MANQSALIKLLKNKRRYMCMKEISKVSGDSLASVNRKINRLCPFFVERKIKKVRIGNKNIHLSYYRYKGRGKNGIDG